jgi:hypothetical protein
MISVLRSNELGYLKIWGLVYIIFTLTMMDNLDTFRGYFS